MEIQLGSIPGLKISAAVVLLALGSASVAYGQASDVGKILYVGSGETGQDFDIYVSDADGSGLTDLSGNDAWESAAAFSPNGRRIAFYSDRDGDQSVPHGERNFEIYVMEADGSDVRRLTRQEGWDAHPAWSNNGRRIAFDSWRDGDGDIYVMNADGSGVVNVSNTDTDEDFPVWSPNGREILFSSTRDRSEPDLYVMRADGSSVRRLTSGPGYNIPADWSPDGRQILFQRGAEIYVINADGSGETFVGDGTSPAWSFNGRHIVFARGNRPWIMDADGSNPRLVELSFPHRVISPTDWSHP